MTDERIANSNYLLQTDYEGRRLFDESRFAEAAKPFEILVAAQPDYSTISLMTIKMPVNRGRYLRSD